MPRANPLTAIPKFFPSISADKNTWFWKHGLSADGLLISYDVLAADDSLTSSGKSIKRILDFNGFVVIDSGAFGESTETDPVVVYETQMRCRPDMAILLDQVASRTASMDQQKQSVDITLRNAAAIQARNNGRLNLMAVVQGSDEKLLKRCATKLCRLKFAVIGIPLSQQSKLRQYETAARKVIAIKKMFDSKTVFHGLGCGSRTMIAILSSLGVHAFDSSSFYKTALHKEAIKPLSCCSIGRPNSKPECRECLLYQRRPRTFRATANYNLREVLKEIQRCRCAIDENKMKQYLQTRVSSRTFKRILPLLG